MADLSPNVENYFIGKGVVSIKREGEGSYRDVGNVPSFEFTPEIDKLDHFSSREGVKTKDRTVVIQKSGTLKIVMEEFTVANMAIALLGSVDENSAGQDVIQIFSENAVTAAVRLVGTNEVGTRFQWDFPRVDFIPSAAVSPITDEWGQLEVSGDVSAVDGSFGTITKLGDESEESESA